MNYLELVSLLRKQINFLKTNEGQNLIWLDYCGYQLADSLGDLTIIQYNFILKGRAELHKKMNEIKDKGAGGYGRSKYR